MRTVGDIPRTSIKQINFKKIKIENLCRTWNKTPKIYTHTRIYIHTYIIHTDINTYTHTHTYIYGKSRQKYLKKLRLRSVMRKSENNDDNNNSNNNEVMRVQKIRWNQSRKNVKKTRNLGNKWHGRLKAIKKKPSQRYNKIKRKRSPPKSSENRRGRRHLRNLDCCCDFLSPTFPHNKKWLGYYSRSYAEQGHCWIRS